MVLRPEDIEQREFGSAMRGFDKAEVRAFLRRVAGEVRYLESEVEAVRGGAVAPAADEPASDLELPRVDTRPAPPMLVPKVGDLDLPTGDLPDLGAPGSQLPEQVPEQVVETEPQVPPIPAALGGRPETVGGEADRFAALGDRIADLLRNAQETAEEVKHQAESDAAQVRAEAAAAGIDLRSSADQYSTQTRSDAASAADELRSSAEAYSTEVRTAADADAAAMRSAAEEVLATAQAEAAEIREHAMADANEMRSLASSELDAARTESMDALSQAEAEAEALRQRAIEEGQASLAGREQFVAQQEAEVSAEREQAMAELADARGQVSTLLQEARAQSEFIRQESEEIIRTKVRANMEQAQRRIDMLRTTETASKDRIAAARKELESALARLDADPAPGLPSGTEDLVLEEAQRAVQDAEAQRAAGEVSAWDAESVDPEPTGGADAGGFGSGIIDVETVAEPIGFDTPVPDPPMPSDADASASDPFESGEAPHHGAFDLDSSDFGSVEDVPADQADVVPPPPPPPGSAEAGAEVVDHETGQTVNGGSFYAPLPEDRPAPPPGFEPPVGIDAPVFDTSENDPVVDTSPSDEFVPTEAPQAPSFDPEPSLPAEHDQESFGEPTSEQAADVHTPENEDALAKLVREAMQRAVDSARGDKK